MPVNGNTSQRLTIRIGRNSLSFSTVDGDNNILYEPFVVKSGVSMAANLREAFKSADLLMEPSLRVRVLIDTDVLMIPIEQFDEQNVATLYGHAFPNKEQDSVYYNVLPDLNAVAAFSMNKDLRLVVDDHFQDVRLITAMSPVWRHMHQRSFTGSRHKLYGYFHEKRLEVFSFQQNRFKFCNSFETSRAHDSLYFLLYVWKQLQLQPQFDELHIVGDIPDEEWILQELRKYLQKAYVINPQADFGQHPALEVKGMPYDLMTLYVKGR